MSHGPLWLCLIDSQRLLQFIGRTSVQLTQCSLFGSNPDWIDCTEKFWSQYHWLPIAQVYNCISSDRLKDLRPNLLNRFARLSLMAHLAVSIIYLFYDYLISFRNSINGKDIAVNTVALLDLFHGLYSRRIPLNIKPFRKVRFLFDQSCQRFVS